MVAPIVGLVAKEGIKQIAKAGAKEATKGLAKEGTKQLGQGIAKLSNTSRDFLASSGAIKEVGKLFQAGGPAMSMVAAQFTAGTMGSRLDLTTSLINLVQSDGFKTFMDNFSIFASGLMDVATDFLDLITKLGNAMGPYRKNLRDFIDALKNTEETFPTSPSKPNEEGKVSKPDPNWLNWFTALFGFGTRN